MAPAEHSFSRLGRICHLCLSGKQCTNCVIIAVTKHMTEIPVMAQTYLRTGMFFLFVHLALVAVKYSDARTRLSFSSGIRPASTPSDSTPGRSKRRSSQTINARGREAVPGVNFILGQLTLRRSLRVPYQALCREWIFVLADVPIYSTIAYIIVKNTHAEMASQPSSVQIRNQRVWPSELRRSWCPQHTLARRLICVPVAISS
jgi:hypothetical protein